MAAFHIGQRVRIIKDVPATMLGVRPNMVGNETVITGFVKFPTRGYHCACMTGYSTSAFRSSVQRCIGCACCFEPIIGGECDFAEELRAELLPPSESEFSMTIFRRQLPPV